ncbi:MAG: hypothetical protein L0G09_15470, partial [Acinetobacter sp.]|nr:hypothetical protein [Acinetobacter sp.]
YLEELVAIIVSLEFSTSDVENLYNIYLDKNMTIPDIKGCLRDVVTGSLNEKDITIGTIVEAFNNAYSSVNNVLR